MKQTTHTEMQPLHAAGYTALCALAKQSKGKKSLSVPVKTVTQMLEAYEDMLDIIAFDEAKKREEEHFPKELVDRLIAGDHALRVYREYRGMTQQKLANASGVSRDMIAMIETGKKNGSLATIKKLASALEIEIEDLA
jgi:DNA-binding XRE family transcriptional regulator